MNFNSLQFLIFFTIVVLAYYTLPKRFKNYMLLGASYFFYMFWNVKYAALMLLSTIITYAAALLIEKYRDKRNIWLTISILINLGILFFFKYYDFSANLITSVLERMNYSVSFRSFDILLPMGISFYTFQCLGYTVDVYRGSEKAEKNFAIYALFVSFFPQLVAGPIERSSSLMPQFKEEHFNWFENIKEGILPALWGFFKKLVIADHLAVVVNIVYSSPADFPAVWLFGATLAFTFQIYCDFSAYSDIARGTARMLGFKLVQNFRQPFFAVSIEDFWRRWHISLSGWFKDYLYIPLGGNRKGRARKLLNIMIVFLVSGLWHGAAMTYVIWGALNGLYQVVGNFLTLLKKRLNLPAVIKIIITFGLTCFAFAFFRANSISDALYIISSIFSMKSGYVPLADVGLSVQGLLLCAGGVVFLVFADFLMSLWDLEKRLNSAVALRYLVYFVLITVILVFGSYGPGYDPQDFVYFQF